MERTWLRQRHYYYAVLLCAALSLLGMVHLWLRMPQRRIVVQNLISKSSLKKQFALRDHIVHLNNLNEICFHEKHAVIPWSYNSTDVNPRFVWNQSKTPDKLLINLLAQCPEIDVFLPWSLRNHGYCEDAMAYVKFLKSRALPMWVLDMTFDYQDRKNITYFDLCPQSGMLFMNHYWEGVPDRPNFPQEKKIIIMPNVEMFELKSKEYYAVDYVLCKTQDAYNRVTQWYEDFGNPRNTTVLYVEHTSSDPSTSAMSYAQSHPEFTIRPKDFKDITFFHANGHSAQKSTTSILECWKNRPDLPRIDIYSMHEATKNAYDDLFRDTGAPSNLRFHFGEDVDGPDFGRLLLEASAIICPSKMEGFGHYINQARAAGALVMTTNGQPMNEFIAPDAGILIDAMPLEPNQNQMLSIYGSMEWGVNATGICNAVDRVLSMTAQERTSHGRNCRKLYEIQFVQFEANMRRLRALFVY